MHIPLRNRSVVTSRPPQSFGLLWLLCLIMMVSASMTATAGWRFPHKKFKEVTETDRLTLPPVCRLLLIEKPGAHLDVGQTQNAQLLARPEYRMAQGNVHLHHYCYGLVNRNRYFGSKTKFERDDWLKETIEEIDYVLINSPKEWPYFYQLYFEQAEMYYIAGDLPRALVKANNSLAHSPNFDKTHALLSDIYKKQGKKDLAITQLHAGLGANPTSKGLLRRLKDLNPSDPYLLNPPKAAEKESPSGGVPTEKKQASQESASIESAVKEPQFRAPPASENPPSQTIIAPQTGTTQSTPENANPYCRFCP